MKAYGKHRRDCPNRTLRGSSRPCPCCIPRSGFRKAKTFKGRARRAGREEIRSTRGTTETETEIEDDT